MTEEEEEGGRGGGREEEGCCACVGKTRAKNYLSCMSIISAWIRLEIITEKYSQPTARQWDSETKGEGFETNYSQDKSTDNSERRDED